MITSISAVSVIPLSSSVENISIGYVNSERMTTFYETSSILEYLPKYSCLSDLQDIFIDSTSINFLTKLISLSSISDLDNVSRTVYYIEDEDEDKNRSVDIRQTTSLDNQFLLTAPLSSVLHLSVIPLKNTFSVSESPLFNGNNRYYDKIYKEGDDIFLQFKSSIDTRTIYPDTVETIYLQEDIPSFNLSSLDIIENGSYIGTCPANSDNIFLDRYGYSNITDSGYAGNNESSEMLCVWTSISGLYERWFDPSNVLQGNAYISTKASDSFNSIVDVSSNVIVNQKNKIQISRLGENRNTAFVNSLSSNLISHFSLWNNRFNDEINDIAGFIVGDYSSIDADRLVLNGSIHAHIPPDDAIYDNANTTISMWVNSDDWSKGVDAQLFGNFSDLNGYGLFYNTGATNGLITLPSNNGTIYGFNFKGYKIFEKNLESLSGSQFRYITTDYFGNRWIWDKNSQLVIKLASDDIVTETITLPLSTEVKSMKIDSQNLLYVHDSITNSVSSFDSFGLILSSFTIPSPSNNFDFSSDNDLMFAFGDNMVVDKDDNVYTTIGRNVYKNSTVWYHIAKKIQTIKLDSDNNVYVFSGEHTLTKIDTTGSKLWNVDINLSSILNDRVEMSFVKEYANGIDYDVLWVVFNERKLLVKVDISSGKIIRRINLKDTVNLKRCGDFELHVKGDFTGFDVKRKFQPAMSSSPQFSAKLNVTCDNRVRTIQLFTPASSFKKGWTHLAFTHKIVGTDTVISLYVNGILRDTTTVDGMQIISHGGKVTPFIIGGNSGKLGAKNVERSLNNSGYFVGEISDIRIYNIPLESGDIKSLSRYKYWNKWTPLIVPIPIIPRTYLEKIKSFHLNKYPGFKSNKFNLILKGISTKIPESSIESYIRSHIDGIKPAHMVLNEIKFD